MRSLFCDSHRAIGVRSFNIRSMWNCGMACESWPRSLNTSQRKFLWVRRGCQASQRKGLTSGEVRELPGNLWIAVKFHSERTSGEVTENLPGKFGELPGKSGDFPEARGSLTPSQRLATFVSKLAIGDSAHLRFSRSLIPKETRTFHTDDLLQGVQGQELLF